MDDLGGKPTIFWKHPYKCSLETAKAKYIFMPSTAPGKVMNFFHKDCEIAKKKCPVSEKKEHYQKDEKL